MGQAASFYLDATESPWAPHFQMATWLLHELPAVVASVAPADLTRQSITGHSMGGHGALVIALRNPGRFRSVSVFAPISAPSDCPWGRKAFGEYLGADRAAWQDYDATALVQRASSPLPLLYDQGAADQYLAEQLQPERFLAAAAQAGYPVDYRVRQGYDHGYCYIATYIEEHLRFHAAHLARAL